MQRSGWLRHSLLWAGIAGIISVWIPIGAGSPITAAAQNPIAFGVPTVVDPIHTNGEPDIAVDPAHPDKIYVSGPTGTGTQRSTWLGSVNHGNTFRIITPGPPPSAATGIDDPPGGGDTDINFDHTGKQYFSDLYALLCLRAATTSDGGATVQQNPDGCALTTTGPGADRQWFAIYDPVGVGTISLYRGPKPLAYIEYTDVGSNGPGGQWDKTSDGLTYSNAIAGGNVFSGQTYSTFGNDGYPAIDQVTGAVFEAAGLDTTSGSATVHNLKLNIGLPDADGNLTFLDHPTAANPGGDLTKLVTIASNLKGDPDTLFPVLSMDSARNLYVVYGINSSKPADRQTYVSASSPATGWTQWTAPVQVSEGSTSNGDAVNVFQWAKAGGPGRIDAVWYGSDKSVNPSDIQGQKWNVFMTQLVFPTDATGTITGAPPTFTTIDAAGRPGSQKVTPHPMHYNDICQLGLGCISQQGNRNLADFFVVTIDQSGAAEIVYDDTSNGLAQPGFTPTGQQADHAGAGVVTVARQSAGQGLFGHDVSGPSNAPVKRMTAPTGDALYGLSGPSNPLFSGTNTPGMDVLGSSLDLSGNTLRVTTQVLDLSNPAATAQKLGAPYMQYVTRWIMATPSDSQHPNTIFYAAMQNTAANQPIFYAGAAFSTDLCSVSACFPHVIDYPEPPVGNSEPGSITCPQSPSALAPCSITISVSTADVGSPTASSLLEEVASYSFASATTGAQLIAPGSGNSQTEADNVPLEIDGACCYNFRTASAVPPPPAPVAGPAPAQTAMPNTRAPVPAAIGLLAVAVAATLAVLGRRRRREKAS